MPCTSDLTKQTHFSWLITSSLVGPIVWVLAYWEANKPGFWGLSLFIAYWLISLGCKPHLLCLIPHTNCVLSLTHTYSSPPLGLISGSQLVSFGFLKSPSGWLLRSSLILAFQAYLWAPHACKSVPFGLFGIQFLPKCLLHILAYKLCLFPWLLLIPSSLNCNIAYFSFGVCCVAF